LIKMNIKKNLKLRKRIARVFIENNLEILSTREIRDKLTDQITVTGKRYSVQPPITQLSNVLRFYNEFEMLTGGRDGNRHEIATWKLTDEGRSLV
tara:strand:+ start:6022 stop:6306 length:285 start_codon:yes stop_codon:yes gene_type:complete